MQYFSAVLLNGYPGIYEVSKYTSQLVYVTVITLLRKKIVLAVKYCALHFLRETVV
jgi:hypothetical protein